MTGDPQCDSGMAEVAAPVRRLTAIGLPPRPAGWVPAQPAHVMRAEPAEPDETHPGPAHRPTESPNVRSRLDAARLAVAARLPDAAASRVERMSAATFGSLAVGLVAVIAAVAVGIHHHRSQQSFDSYAVQGPAPAASAGTVADGSSIVVDVAGNVRHPGLVTLPVGARVADAIKAAGGAVRHRDLDRVDLAQRVTDGELLTVGARRGRASSGAASKLVHLSTASLTKLETLPGVGPVTAQKIIAWRNAHGGFTSVSELQQVSGIGPARYAQLSPLVAP